MSKDGTEISVHVAEQPCVTPAQQAAASGRRLARELGTIYRVFRHIQFAEPTSRRYHTSAGKYDLSLGCLGGGRQPIAAHAHALVQRPPDCLTGELGTVRQNHYQRERDEIASKPIDLRSTRGHAPLLTAK